MTKLIFGCGYLGLRVAKRWVADQESVVAVTRSPQRARELADLGITPRVADVTEPASLKDLPAAQTLLYAVGYDRQAGKSMRQVYVEGLQNVLAALPAQVNRIIYISSTGVYGQTEGDWVDEKSPCSPSREGGRACFEAEEVLQTHSLGPRAIILRMGGLYGPGRIPRRAELMEGKPLSANEHGFLNLIHVDDAAEVVLAAERYGAPPALYAVTDGHPVLRGDYFRDLAQLVGASPPTFERPAPGSHRAERSASDKRVSNRKLLSELPFVLRYPNHRAGLAAILAEE